MPGEFVNEALTDFSKPENRNKMEEALARIEGQMGREWSLVIGGKRCKSRQQFQSLNPSDPQQVVGVFQKAAPEEGVEALEVALKTFEAWKREPAAKRAECCFRAAELFRKRKFEMSAWMVLEVGKSWVEADADVAEGIDMVEFYGREALRYAGEQPITRIASERSELRYIPLGVGVVIPPWNFPFAILVGMTSGAFVCGNTVVLKPSSDAPGIATQVMEVFEEAGVPAGVVNLVTGPGGEVGDVLVKDAKTRFVSFTGSKEVGLHINEQAARTAPGQRWIKRVVAEMGGKNAIIVDSEADLDAAALGVMSSAFGYQGQKCSACSRAIVLADVYDAFIEKLLARTKKITVGLVKSADNWMGPVINAKAMKTILEYIEIGKGEGKVICGGERIGDTGYFIQPTIIKDVARKARIAQEEIFGPVMVIIKARDFDEAIDIANDTEYGLTGSVYTTNRKKMEKASDEFHVGNLYMNRKSTGALVGVHPFGGFNMSGTDSKAGGRDYLLLFLQAKSISEKVS